ncbi:hypothetical protein [Oerskovia sp. Root22]|uniref:hypothetical protein n=1 Tax=Oerskovia sp. Root22 TaxID=1736494 RepID=UPI000AC85492|nr:hypothetical protein [Oerskovia sp. Root22]
MTASSVPGPTSPRPRGLGRGEVLGLVAGVLLVGVGGWLASRSYGAASFGWFAYAPLSGAVYEPSRPWSQVLGLVAAGAGLLVLGFVAGWVVARRRGGDGGAGADRPAERPDA